MNSRNHLQNILMTSTCSLRWINTRAASAAQWNSQAWLSRPPSKPKNMFCKANVPDRQVCFQGLHTTSSSSPQRQLSLIQVRADPKDCMRQAMKQEGQWDIKNPLIGEWVRSVIGLLQRAQFQLKGGISQGLLCIQQLSSAGTDQLLPKAHLFWNALVHHMLSTRPERFL